MHRTIFSVHHYVLPGDGTVEGDDHSLLLSCLFARDWGATPAICDAILQQRDAYEDAVPPGKLSHFLRALLTVARHGINTHYADSAYHPFVLREPTSHLEAALAQLGVPEDELNDFLEAKLDQVVEISYLDEMLKQEKFADFEEGVYKFTLRDGGVRFECVDRNNPVIDVMRQLNAVAAEPN